MVAIGYRPPEKAVLSNATVGPQLTDSTSLNNVDDLMATNLAANLADTADLPVKYDVANMAQTLYAANSIAQTDTSVIVKPQIVQPTADISTIQKYTTVTGDTIPGIAEKFGVSAQTIKWANKLTSDAVEPGKELSIPPTDGTLYTVKAGDTVETLATKYQASISQIIAYNDLELNTTLTPGAQLIIPEGVLPENERPGYVAPVSNVSVSSYTYTATYGGGSTWKPAYGWSAARPDTGYPFGQCTWYAAVRRAELGRPVARQLGNGGTWHYKMAASREPTVGSIMDGAGHVAIVEMVEPGVGIYISEMNGYRYGGGWGRVGFGFIPWSQAVNPSFWYIP